MNGFSWHFQDRPGLEQGTFWNILSETRWGPARLFHIPQIRRGGGLRSRNAFCFIIILRMTLSSILMIYLRGLLIPRVISPSVSTFTNMFHLRLGQWYVITHVVIFAYPLQRLHNERLGVSNHRRLDCLLNRLFKRLSKETSKLHITGLCEGNPLVIGGFLSQKASDAETVSIWWRHHGRVIRYQWLLLNHHWSENPDKNYIPWFYGDTILHETVYLFESFLAFFLFSSFYTSVSEK